MSTTVTDIKTSFYKGNLEECISMIKLLADEHDNALAADVYGDLLMMGVWDTRKMEVDLVRGRLQPVPLNDSYLILARDPLKAIIYYKRAAYSIDQPENSPVKLRANAKIEYCKARGLAGFKASHISIPRLKSSVARFLDTNAKNSNKSNDLESTNFVPMPDVRPLVQNPLKSMFSRLGLKFRNRCLVQIFVAQLAALISFFYSYKTNTFLLFFSVFVSISVPLAIFASIGHFQGYKRGLPVCCCTKISNAFELSTKSLPPDCKPQMSPFETTESYIRYSQTIKGLYFWVFILIALLRVIQIILEFGCYVCWITKLSDCDPKGVLFYTVPVNFLIISTFILFWDKDFSLSNIKNVFGEHEGGSAFIYVMITLFISILAHDEDCERESERLKENSHLQILVESL